jgi:hypothetical protein
MALFFLNTMLTCALVIQNDNDLLVLGAIGSVIFFWAAYIIETRERNKYWDDKIKESRQETFVTMAIMNYMKENPDQVLDWTKSYLKKKKNGK